MSDLEKKYAEVLGGSDTGTLSDAEEKSSPGIDGAYEQADYEAKGDDAFDPRDESTHPEDKGDKEIADGADKEETEEEAGEEKGSEEEKKDDEGSEAEADEEPEDSEEEIDPVLVTAARNAGLTDEDIIELAETKPAVLQAIAKADAEARSSIAKKAPAQTEVAKTEEKASTKKMTPLEHLNFNTVFLDLPEGVGEMLDDIKTRFNTVVDETNDLRKKVGDHGQDLTSVKASEQAAMIQRIDGFFDSVSEEMPVFGKTDSLTQEQVDARIEAYSVAEAMQKQHGTNLLDGLKTGVNALKGKRSETKLKAKLIKDLSKNSKRMTARPGSKKKSVKHKSEEAAGMAAIDGVMEGW